MNDKFFLVLSPSEWSDNAVSNMQISAILSKNNDVVYVETIGTRIPKFSEWRRIISRLYKFFFKRNKKNFKKGLDPVNVKIVSPIAFPYHKSNIINKINVFLIKIQLRSVLPKNKKIYIWSFSPIWENYIETISKKFRIFHCVDALHTYDDTQHYKSLLEKALRKSNIVFTPGILLLDELKEYNEQTFIIGHGCGQKHLENNNNFDIPSDLEGLNLSNDVVVYAGTLANWVDYELLIFLASNSPDITFLLIGYIHPLAPKNEVNKLLDFTNVIHVGYKNYDELPSYYSLSSIGIIPYQSNNEHIRYSTPTKFLDYFSAGLQTVSTDFPAAYAYDKGFVKIASSKQAFLDLLLNGLQDIDEERSDRIRFYAKDHSWDNQVKKMYKLINQAEDLD